MILGNTVLAYIGPEVVLPIMSVLAAILGAVMIYWHWVIGFIQMGSRKLVNRPKKEGMAEPMERDDIDV